LKVALPKFPIEGGCVCRAIRYRLNAPPVGVWACHCKRCQAYTGAYTISMPVRRADIEISGITPVEHNAPADSGRMARIFFCPNCHTRVWHAPAVADNLTLMAGTLDDTSWVTPVAHIFTRYKQAGTHIDPQALSYEDAAPDRALLLAAWRNALV
jgi:hypothetical protein